MSIKWKPSSILGFVLGVSLIAYFGGIYSGQPALVEAAKPILVLAGGIWLAFILLTLVRNAKTI